MTSFLKSCLALGDWESALSHLSKLRLQESQGIDTGALNLAISCCIKGGALKSLHNIENLIHERNKRQQLEKSSNLQARPKPSKTFFTAHEVKEVNAKFTARWPRSKPSVTVPSDRFAKIFGTKIEACKETTNEVQYNIVSTEARPNIDSKTMVFFPSSRDIGKYCELLIDNDMKEQALRILERHILLLRFAKSTNSRNLQYFLEVETIPQEIDETVAHVIKSCINTVDHERLVSLVVCSGSQPLSSAVLISKLEDVKCRDTVKSLLSRSSPKTNAALTSTYSALIATWIHRRR